MAEQTISYPLINGRKYDHSSAEVQLRDKLHTGVTALNWSQSLEPGLVRGTRPEVIARTTGEYEAEGDFSMPLEDYAALIADLGDGYMAISFNIVANYSNEGQNNTKVELVGCRITGEEGGSEEGGDPAMVEVSLSIMRVEVNGRRAVPGMLT